MKNTVLQLCAAAILFSAASSFAAHRIENPGFETEGLADWSQFGQGWRIGSDEDALSGSSGAINDVLPSDTDEWRGIYQTVPVTAGATYSSGVSIRTVGVRTSCSFFELQWLDANGEVIGQLQSERVTEDQPFTAVGLGPVVAPAGSVAASVRGIVYTPKPPDEEPEFHIFDDFTFR